MKIAISAAETSGDLIGAKLVSALKAQNSDIQIEGMAGERMLEAGCVQLWDKNLANVMGLITITLPITCIKCAWVILTISSIIFCLSSLSSARILIFNNSCK
jgi:lipid A disaccharide synthetase